MMRYQANGAKPWRLMNPTSPRTTTSADSAFIRAQKAAYQRAGVDPILWPRMAGSWPGYVFTGAPVSKPAGQFGLGHGNGAHAPDEYYLIESKNPKVFGMDAAIRSYVDFFYEMAAQQA